MNFFILVNLLEQRIHSDNQLNISSSGSIFSEDESNLAKLKALFDNVDVLLWSVKEYPDGQLYYEKVNDNFASVTGRKPSDYDGKPVIELGTEEEYHQIQHSLSVAKENGFYTYERSVGSPPEFRSFFIRIIALPENDGGCTYIGSATDITDRVNAEEALKEEKNKAQKYLDVSGVIMLVINSDQKVGLINRKGYEILGYDEENIVGKNWFDNFVPLRLREETKASFLKVKEGEQPSDNHENFIITKSGIERTILWHSAVLKDEQGNFLGLLGSGEDITERKKTEEELISTKQLLERITYASPTFISVFDIVDEKILFRNYSVLESLGYPPDELKRISSLPHKQRLFMYHPDDMETIDRHDENILKIKDRQVIEAEYRIKSYQGDWQWFRHLSAVFLRNEKGEPIQSVNIFENITERKKAERELVSTKQLLEKITDTSPAIISVVDTESGNNIYQNRSLADFLGYSDDESKQILESPDGIYKLIHPDDASLYLSFKEKISQMKEGRSYPLEFRMRGRKGNWHWIRRLSSVFQRGADGRPVQIVNIFENITDYKRAEEKLNRRTDQIIKQQSALLELSKMKSYEPDAVFKLISEITSQASNAERVSIWLYNEDLTALSCKDFYNISEKSHESGIILNPVDFSKLFQVIKREVNTIYNNEDFDSQTRLFIEKYLLPFGSASLLTAPIRLHGDVIGYICYEIRERADKEWSVEEYDFVLSVSGFISMVLESAERMKAEKEIKNSLKEKELLLREIHHRVKNNLQVISSLLYLQSKKIKDKQTLDVFIESQNRVKTMVLVHEKLYQSKDFIKIDHSEYIRSLVNSVFQSYKVNPDTVRLDINVQNLYLNLDTTIHCGLIINELVSNSLKYAFPEGKGGAIGVDFRLDENDVYNLTVRDDGIGFPENVNFRETESLGFQLVLTLVDQLEGTIEMVKDHGTAFKILFSSKRT